MYVAQHGLCHLPYRGQQLFYLLAFWGQRLSTVKFSFWEYHGNEFIQSIFFLLVLLSWEQIHNITQCLFFILIKKISRKRTVKEWNELHFGFYGCLVLWTYLNKSQHKNELQNKMKNFSDNLFMSPHTKYIKKRLRLPLKEVSYIWTLITSPICSINQMWHQVDSFLPSNQYKITKAPFSIWVSPVSLCGPAVHYPPFNIT